jgi:citrate lyase subunit beta/citryl-CoA lyase
MNVWRSYLFVPAKKLSMIKKAVFSEADSVILDLEDAVAHSEKDSARELVKEALSEFGGKKPIYVRINDFSVPYWEKDLLASISSGVTGVVVPKSQSAEEIRLICDKARSMFKEFGTKEMEADFEVIPLLETAKGIQFAYEIANADPLVSNMAFGSIDFSLDIGCELSPGGEELLYARSKIVIASRAAGKGAPIDAVYPELTHPDGLEYETKFAKRLGFKAKLVIHPKQVETVHNVFKIGKEELQEAKEIVEEFEKAEKKGLASISVNKKLVDYPVYKKAKEIVTSNNREI